MWCFQSSVILFDWIIQEDETPGCSQLDAGEPNTRGTPSQPERRCPAANTTTPAAAASLTASADDDEPLFTVAQLLIDKFGEKKVSEIRALGKTPENKKRPLPSVPDVFNKEMKSQCISAVTPWMISLSGPAMRFIENRGTLFQVLKRVAICTDNENAALLPRMMDDPNRRQQFTKYLGQFSIG